jgi:hypothetical protein
MVIYDPDTKIMSPSGHKCFYYSDKQTELPIVYFPDEKSAQSFEDNYVVPWRQNGWVSSEWKNTMKRLDANQKRNANPAKFDEEFRKKQDRNDRLWLLLDPSMFVFYGFVLFPLFIYSCVTLSS